MKHRSMRTLITIFLVITLLLGCCIAGYAVNSSSDFRYTVGKDGLTLTAYTGDAASLTIPAQIDGKPVTAIGNGCFQGMVCLKRVHVPEGVQRVDDYAFEACSALQRIYLPASLTEIGAGAFSGCGHLTLVDMQDDVKRIGAGAFLCCDALVSVELSKALRELGDFAFAGCASLASVTFDGEALTAIPNRAFYGCESLTRINLPQSVTAIGKRAFSGCTSLRSFYYGTLLESLGAYAFEKCVSMTSADVTAPIIRQGTFAGCSELSYLRLSDGVQRIEPFALSNSGVTDLTFGGTVTEVAPGAFYGSNLKSVTPEEETAYQTIDGALLTADGKTLLYWLPTDPYAEEPQTDYTVPEGVETIAEYAFAFCPLTTIQLPASLKEIRAYAFAYTEVQDMAIPDGVTVDSNAFRGPEETEEAAAQALSAAAEPDGATSVKTKSAAGDKSLYHEADYQDFKEIANEDFDAWCEDYLAYNEKQGNPIRIDLIPYIMRYKGEVIPHFIAMTAVQNHDPEMWADAVNMFGDDFEAMYLMMNHGLFTELRRGRMQDDLVLYSGVYDSQLMAAAGTDTVPTREQLIGAIGSTFSDPVMISTTPDPAVACGFGETLFIIYASREAMEAQGAVCIDAAARSSENEILMAANARYRVLDVGDMTVTYPDPWDGTTVTQQRNYVRVELLGPETPANPFEDVLEGQYYYDAVLWAVKNGVTNGVDQTHFAPSTAATRAQMMTFLWRAAGMPEPKTTKIPFADVADDAYYARAVLWAAEQGITNGTDKTHFSPNQVCSRGEFVTFLYRFCQSPKVSGSSPFADVQQGSYYYDAVLWASETGVTNGTDATHFSPAKSCSRGETVTLLYRALS